MVWLEEHRSWLDLALLYWPLKGMRPQALVLHLCPCHGDPEPALPQARKKGKKEAPGIVVVRVGTHRGCPRALLHLG